MWTESEQGSRRYCRQLLLTTAAVQTGRQAGKQTERTRAGSSTATDGGYSPVFAFDGITTHCSHLGILEFSLVQDFKSLAELYLNGKEMANVITAQSPSVKSSFTGECVRFA